MGKSTLLGIIEYLNSFEELFPTSQKWLELLDNKGKQFEVFHTWEKDDKHTTQHQKNMYEYIKIKSKKKSPYISEYATFRGNDVVLFFIKSKNEMYYSHFPLEKNISSKEIEKFIINKFKEKEKFRKIPIFTFIGHKINKINDLFSAFGFLSKLLDNGDEEYNKLLSYCEGTNSKDKWDNSLIIKYVTEISSQITRLYNLSKIKVVEGIRPKKIEMISQYSLFCRI